MISVIMLTYNREALVGRAIESILAQSLRNFEFIIIDNGSTDNSGKIADEYAVRDNRIRVFHKARGNIGFGRNVGLSAARGDYIFESIQSRIVWYKRNYREVLENNPMYMQSAVINSNSETFLCNLGKESFSQLMNKYFVLP